jgi:cell division septation protein DedD
MRNNETGEYEWNLGTPQVLSGFFIAVILFAVFFAMGYIVGKNSVPSARMQAETNAPGAAVAPDTRPRPAPQPAAPAAPAPDAAAPAAAEAPKSDTAATTPAAPTPLTEPGGTGTYLQIMAVRQAEADVVLRTLKDKGLPAVLGPGPSGLVRVLVGPYPDAASLGKAKAELENAGFHAFVKK